jgi:hypothetical protein
MRKERKDIRVPKGYVNYKLTGNTDIEHIK